MGWEHRLAVTKTGAQEAIPTFAEAEASCLGGAVICYAAETGRKAAEVSLRPWPRVIRLLGPTVSLIGMDS